MYKGSMLEGRYSFIRVLIAKKQETTQSAASVTPLTHGQRDNAKYVGTATSPVNTGIVAIAVAISIHLYLSIQLLMGLQNIPVSTLSWTHSTNKTVSN